MGYPVNNYTFFKAIAEEDHSTLSAWFKKDFGAYGIILHDPLKHKAFSQQLDKDFYKHHMITGDDLFFSAIADPPKAWIEWAREEQAFGGLAFWEIEKLSDPTQIIESFDPSYTALFIAEVLGIHHHYLPVIVFTPDLASKQYYFIRTSAAEFSDHITELIMLAKSLKKGCSIENALAQTNIRDYKKISLDKEGLAHRLFYLSKELLKSASNKAQLEDANIYQHKLESPGFSGKNVPPKYTPDKETTMLSPANLNAGASLEEESDWLMEEFMKEPSTSMRFSISLTPTKAAGRHDEAQRLFQQNQQWLEPQTIAYLEQGFRRYEACDRNEDASPYALPFAKATEKEMTYSITHWVRKQFNIQLPEFYYEFEPEKNAVITTTKKLVDFNEERYYRLWKPPMLGGQIHGFSQSIIDLKVHPFKSNTDYGHFVDILHVIMNVRNKLTHSDPISRDELDDIIHSWKRLFEGPYLPLLADMKESLRN